MGGNPEASRKRVDDGGDDGVAGDVCVPILAQNLPLSMPAPPYAKSLRLHFRHCLVGHCSQLDRLFCRFPRKHVILLS